MNIKISPKFNYNDVINTCSRTFTVMGFEVWGDK